MTAAASPLACTFRFRHPKAERKNCGLPVLVERAGEDPRCPWHDPAARPAGFNIRQELEKELQSPNHWLEGAKLAAADLRNLSAYDGHLPCADLEKADLQNALLDKAILDDAILISAKMTSVTLGSASLVGAKLDCAELIGADLMYCDLSGAILHGAKLDRASLYGVKLSSETVLLGVVWGTTGELLRRRFDQAASVFRTVRSHFRSQSNMREAEDFYFWEMTALHLWAINAEFDPEHNHWLRWGRRWLPRNWRLDKWIGWALHRWGWGYGVRPLYTVGWMLFVWLLFGLAIYPVVGIQLPDEKVTHNVPSALALSAVTFTTLGYGNRTPCGTIGECCGGLEALLGALLISVFVVALATKYVYVS
jgi:hypothetical protein